MHHTENLGVGFRLLVCAVAAIALYADVVLAEDPPRPEPKHPNILLILADDLGYGDPGCYNEQSKVPTPHLDRLAREGLRFTDAHSPAAVCTPTRYSLMTGQMAFRVKNGGTVFTGVGGPSLITPGRLTLPKILEDKGYATACVGKWHVGLTFHDHHGQPIRDNGIEAVRRVDFTRRIDGGPLDHGFQSFFGTACCPTTDWLYAFIENDRVRRPPSKVIDRTLLPRHPYSQDCRPGLIADDFPMEEVDLVFLKKSLDFLDQHVQQSPEQPFFLFHAAQAVHLPSFAAPQFQGSTQAGPHGDFIHQFDWIVGQLMGRLDKLGVADNTLVIVTSDNGPEVTSVVHMRQDHAHDPARPWRGMKRDAWEGGHRVPFLVRWPSNGAAGGIRLRPGSTCSQLISLTDVMATAAEIVGTSLPDDAAEDSFSLLPCLREDSAAPIRPYLLLQAFAGARTLSIRRGEWKYIDHPGSGGNRYDKDPSLLAYQHPETAPDTPAQLYNLSTDPGETHNLILEHPTLAAELKQLLETSKTTGRSRPRVATEGPPQGVQCN
jgi:arylsulfatase A-like enzyme